MKGGLYILNECPYVSKCIFFEDKMSHIPTIVTLMQESYCKNNFKECAIFIIFNNLGSNYIPTDLFPHEYSRAMDILENNK